MSRAGNDNANVDDAKVKQKAKVIQIQVKEWVFIVPFDFKTNKALEAIDFMGRGISLPFIHSDFCCELSFNPSARG